MPDGAVLGGVQNAMLHAARCLHLQGHKISLLAGSRRGDTSENMATFFPWIEFYPISISENAGGISRGLQFSLKGLMHVLLHRRKIKQSDILHSYSGYHQLAFLTTISSKITGMAAVHSLYCPVTNEMDGRRSWLLWNGSARLNLCGIDRCIAASQNIRKSLENAGIDPGRIRVVPPGIDTDRFSPEVSGVYWREKLRLSKDVKLVFYLGNLTPVKGLDIAVDALELVARKDPNLFFVYVLQGNHKRFDYRGPEFKKRLETIPLRGAKEIGPTLQIEQLMAAADLHISPLRSTNGLADLPVSIMEMMSIGKPIVTTPVGGVPELITHGKTGLFARPGSPEDLADKMMEILKSPEQASSLAANAREFAVNSFSVDRMAEKTLKVYEELV